jgi:ABC-type transporter Mla subunit MlaD
LELGQSRNKELSDEIARLEQVQAATQSILDNTRDQLKEEVSNSASLKKKYDSVVLCVDSSRLE